MATPDPNRPPSEAENRIEQSAPSQRPIEQQPNIDEWMAEQPPESYPPTRGSSAPIEERNAE
ncbi:MAG: hypothetical protein GYB68_03590, partial [Chloroflexi bacterium]|nr:hypothetical protein [Chloroflexota bacterium]